MAGYFGGLVGIGRGGERGREGGASGNKTGRVGFREEL